MSRNKYYQKLLNSKRWKDLRRCKLQQSPLCERCLSDGKSMGIPSGIITSAVDVHHIIPVESAKTLQGMEILCFNPQNLQSLCVSCHVKIHKEMRSTTKQQHQQRERDRLSQWISRNTRPTGGEDTNG